MGTYTTNYNLFMPSVGETGWGELVNGNFSTIDTTMKNLSNRITAVENEVNGALNCTSVTTSGKITGNGGIAGTTGTFSGAVTANKLDQSAVHTISSGSPANTYSQNSVSPEYLYFVLPKTITNYTGNIKIKTYSGTSDAYTFYVRKGSTNLLESVYVGSNAVTISFTNVDSVYIWAHSRDAFRMCTIGAVTLS